MSGEVVGQGEAARSDAFAARLRRAARWLAASRSAQELAILVVMLMAAGYTRLVVQQVLDYWNSALPPSWTPPPPGRPPGDIDTLLIHGGLEKAPHFLNTLHWWVGTWVGQVPFYRPLSSLVFWVEWKLCGDHEFRYLPFALLLHLLAVYQFMRLAGDLFRHFRCPWPALATLIAGLIFVNGLIILPSRQDITYLIYSAWKNQPDPLCALFFFLALRCYLAAMRRETEESAPACVEDSGVAVREGATTDRWRPTAALGRQGALLFYLASCASKEAGVFLPLLLIWLEWPHLRSPDRACQKTARRRLLPLLLALPLFLLWRALCLRQAIGFRYGNNRNWPYHFMLDALGPVLMEVVLSRWFALLLGLALFAVFWRLRAVLLVETRPAARSAWPWLLQLAGLVGVLALLGASLVPLMEPGVSLSFFSRPFIALLLFAEPECLRQALAIALFLTGFVNALLLRPRLALFGYSWALLGLALTLFSPATIHRFYLPEGGYALLLGGGLTLWPTRKK